MSTRYVWSKYKVTTQDSLDVTFIGRSGELVVWTGAYISISGTTTPVLSVTGWDTEENVGAGSSFTSTKFPLAYGVNGSSDADGYLLAANTDAYVYADGRYTNADARIYGSNITGFRADDISYAGFVSSNSASAHTYARLDGSAVYIYKGSDSPDPASLRYSSSSLKGGDSITLTVTKSSSDLLMNIKYQYEYSTDGGATWKTISTTYGTSVNFTIPTEITSFQARVHALDTSEYESANYLKGALLSVSQNTAPTAPGSITVPVSVKGGGTLEISWTASTDADGNLAGYMLERSYNGGSWTQIYQGSSLSYTDSIAEGWATVAYRVRAYDSDYAYSDYTTGDTRTVTNNSAPSAPETIVAPTKPHSEADISISWTASTDPDGDTVSYELSRQLDSGDWEIVYTGTELLTTDNIPKGTGTVAYRVRAYDPDEAYSDYTTTSTRDVNNNSAPVITCELSGDLGTKDAGFTIPYTVTDPEGDTVTVEEYVGSMLKRSYTATLGEETSFNVLDEDGDYFFTRILNGDQTAKIIASDTEGGSTELDLTFTKAVYAMSVTLRTPMAVEDDITVAIMSIVSSIPSTATVELLATNNALDDSPVWQDIWDDVQAARNIVFENTTQENGPAFNFKLSVARAEGGTGGYVSSLAGAFQ